MTNEDILKGKWKQFKGQAKQKWGKLTDDEIDRVEGKAEEMAGLLQERYGMSKAEAQKEINDLMEHPDAR